MAEIDATRERLDGRYVDAAGVVFDLVTVGAGYQSSWREPQGGHRWTMIEAADAQRLVTHSRRLGDVPRE